MGEPDDGLCWSTHRRLPNKTETDDAGSEKNPADSERVAELEKQLKEAKKEARRNLNKNLGARDANKAAEKERNDTFRTDLKLGAGGLVAAVTAFFGGAYMRTWGHGTRYFYEGMELQVFGLGAGIAILLCIFHKCRQWGNSVT